MPNSRLIKSLLVLSLFLIGLALFFFYRQVPHPRYPYAKAVDSATGLCLLEGKRGVQLNKVGDGWTVHPVDAPDMNVKESTAAFPAESDRVKSVLNELKDVQVEDVISERSDRQAEFEINPDSGMRVVLLAPSSILADGVFGKQAPDFTHIYFRFPDKPSIYLARGLIRGELGKPVVNDWRNHDLIGMSEAQIQSITIEGKGFKTYLVRSSDTWTLNGEKIDPGPVYGLVGALAHLRAEDFVDPTAQPLITYDRLNFARVQVNSDHGSIDLRIGPLDRASQRYPAAASKDGGIAWIVEMQGNAILKKPADLKPAGK